MKQNLVARFKEDVTAPYIPDNMTSTFVGQLSELIEKRFAAYNDDAHFAQKVRLQQTLQAIGFAYFRFRLKLEEKQVPFTVENVQKTDKHASNPFDCLK